MIQRVSNQNKSALGNEEDSRIERQSPSKSAIDSFSQALVLSAKTLVSNGESVVDVAGKLKIKPEFLQEMLKADTSKKDRNFETDQLPSVKSKSDKNSSHKNSELSKEEIDAIAAYNSLHNINQTERPNLHNLSSKRILSNKGGEVKDLGGATKQIGSERNNSIFDSEVVARQTKVKTNDEILRANAKKRTKDRENAKKISRYETIDGKSIVEALKSVDQRKNDGIRSLGVSEAHNYNNRLPSNGIGIFDTKYFERVAEPTAGEQRRSDIKKAANAPKDRAWVADGAKSVTSTDIVSNFINSMLDIKKKG